MLESPHTRRVFLIAAGTAGASAYLAGPSAWAAPPPSAPIQAPPQKPKLTFTANVRRARDFVSLRFDFYNLVLDGSDPANPVVRRDKPSKTSVLVVGFEPQAIAEEAFFEGAPEFTAIDKPGDPATNSDSLEDPGDVDVRLSGASRLAFLVPGDAVIPYTYDGLLNWVGLAQSIVPVAKSFIGRNTATAPKIREPDDWETALEVPWRLVLSPNEKAGWAHATEPVEFDERVELWHTRLGVFDVDHVDELDPSDRTIRAVWALDPDFKNTVKDPVQPNPATPSPFAMSLTARDRESIVRLTSDYGIKQGKLKNVVYTPKPADVNRLMLSSLGAWIDVHGKWELDLENSALIALEEWRHRGVLGRDTYVRIVEKGLLCPPGLDAVVIRVTERKVQSKSFLDPNVAYLRQRYFVVVRRHTRLLGDVLGMPDDGRGFPFDHIQITTLVTPNLLPPGQTGIGGGIPATQAWVPHLAPGVPFRFHAIGTDKAGRPHEFTTPLVFVDGPTFIDPANTASLVAAYGALDEDLRTAVLEGNPVAMAESTKLGDTDVELESMLLDVQAADAAMPAGQAPFFPRMASAEARIGVAEQASGGDVGGGLEYYQPYVDGGFTNREVFLKLNGAGAPIDFPTDKSGGVIQPNFTISGISRRVGPTGGAPASVNDPSINPADFFGSAGKLLGGVLLKDIIGTIVDLDGPKAMKLKTTREGEQVVTELSWQPDLQSTDIFDASLGPATMDLNAKIVTHLTDPAQSTFEVRGDLRGFAINLMAPDGAASFLRIEFNRLSFRSEKGQSSEVDVDISNNEFKGVLAFVQKLQELLSIGGGDDPGAGIDLTPTGITAKFEVPIPSIEVGVFAISNIKFSAGLSVPFTGDPVRARFGFSDRSDMFVLQVSMFAGGGFFGIAVGADGVEQIEAALEFGARLALDIGVASGCVEAMAGIYFSYGQDENGVQTTILTGYVRLKGELCVIEVVSLTLEFYMGLTYSNAGGKEKVYGQATLTVTVEVLVFSGDVTMTVERQFGGDDGDPTFAEQMTPADWTTYAKAFAPVAA